MAVCGSHSEIEMGSIYPAHPCSLLWSPSLHQDPRQLDLCLASMLFTLKIWRTCSTKFSLSLPRPPLSNVLFNPLIQDSLSTARVEPWALATLFQLHHFVHPVTRRLLAFKDLQAKYLIPKHVFFSYLQIKYYLSVSSPIASTAQIHYFCIYMCSRSTFTTFNILHIKSSMKSLLSPKIYIGTCANGHPFSNALCPFLIGIRSGPFLLKFPDVWHRERQLLKS